MENELDSYHMEFRGFGDITSIMEIKMEGHGNWNIGLYMDLYCTSLAPCRTCSQQGGWTPRTYQRAAM